MKLTVLLILVTCFCISQPGVAQNKKKLYYSKSWELTVQDSATYYRVCSLDTIRNKFDGEVTDFLINDQLIMKGSYNAGQKNGIFSLYHPNGQLESQGEFKGNERIGNWKYYFPDGKMRLDVVFRENDFFVNSLYDASGKLTVSNGTGDWYYEYEWYKSTSTIVVTGRFVNGKKDGEWRCSAKTGDLLYEETFSKDKFKKGILFESGNKVAYAEEYKNKLMLPYKFEVTEKFLYLKGVTRVNYPFLRFLPRPITKDTTDTTDPVFTVVEEQASPVGGISAFVAYVGQNLRYPKEARTRGIEGSVFVSFIVNKNGTISDVAVVKGIGGGCDEEAVRIVSNSENWNPGVQNGKPVRSRYVMPIRFKIGQSPNR